LKLHLYRVTNLCTTISTGDMNSCNQVTRIYKLLFYYNSNLFNFIHLFKNVKHDCMCEYVKYDKERSNLDVSNNTLYILILN